jgi:hypothetical protein
MLYSQTEEKPTFYQINLGIVRMQALLMNLNTQGKWATTHPGGPINQSTNCIVAKTANWWMLTTANAAGTNDLTALPK